MDGGDIRAQRAEGADLPAAKTDRPRWESCSVGIVVGREGAAILHVRADIDRGGHEGPVQRAAEQAQGHGEVGIILQRQLAAFHRAPQAIGEAENFKRRKSAFRLGDRAGRREQVQLLAVAVENRVQVAPPLAQKFAAENNGVRADRQGGAAGILHAVPTEAAHRFGQGNQIWRT